MSALVQQIRKTIAAHRMIAPGERIAVACSGGADSTALLLLLHEMAEDSGWVVSVAHLNHCLRGRESDADEEFVRQLAERLGLEFHGERAEVGRLAAISKKNVEAQARQMRLRFFHSLIEARRAGRVALAHTADDQAETVLYRLLRGSGTRGLAGIRPVVEGKMIRPLLEVRRSALRQWLTSRGESWREDTTNQDLRLVRNRIRHQLLPQLVALNPALIQTLAHTAELARAEEDFWKSYLQPILGKVVSCRDGCVTMNIADLQELPEAVAFRVLRWAASKVPQAELHDGGKSTEAMGYGHVKELLHWALAGQSGGILTLPQKIEARKEFSNLMLRRSTDVAADSERMHPTYSYEVHVPSVITLSGPKVALRFDFVPLTAGQARYNKTGTILLDSKLAGSPLSLRNWRAGDAYQPQGHRNKKKLHELLQRARIPVRDRAAWPVLTAADQIVWVRGLAVAEGHSPSSGSTEAIGIREIGAE